MPFPPRQQFTRSSARRTGTAPLLLLVLTLCLAPLPGVGHATTKDSTRSAHGEVSKKKKSTKVKQGRSPSEESRSERDRRLYRECKGRANAGACLGYTQKP
ncbi:hypothetical protein [Acidovorax sp. Root70]|uniref:hypothetical protein n=1 Tax=Acidovorax sp. Root70 TaxID=1736590 RepID=UPI001F43667D|nr:hypothetical protein [Acidovorax sp. Root70]